MKLPFLRNQDGSAAVEFGLVAPILTAVLVGVGTFGGTILAYNKMRQAVSSGAEYAMAIGTEDTAAIKQVVEAAWSNKPDGSTVTVVQACYCGTQVATAHDCSTICDDGDYPLKVTTIHAAMTYADIGGESHAISSEQKIRNR